MPADPAVFGAYVRDAATSAGYDLTGPRSGGIRDLARDSGMSHATVSRMLAGRTIPDLAAMPHLARALRLGLGDVIERAMGLAPGTLTRAQSAPPARLTPQDAARRLGIRDRRSAQVFTALVAALRDAEPTA